MRPEGRPGVGATWYGRLITNHPLANISFGVVLLLGLLAYLAMPREQDPEVNFNWVSIITPLPGATAEEVERLVTNPLEDAIDGVADLRFVVSTSRDSLSSILVRFREMPDATFDKRVTDLRREVQNKVGSELPPEAKDPMILEVTTNNGFPSATLMVTGRADDEILRSAGRRIKADVERLAGVDQVFASGLRNPELRIVPDAAALAARGLDATHVADALRLAWRDTAARSLDTRQGAWAVGLTGVVTDPEALASLPVGRPGRPGPGVRLADVARIERGREQPSQLASLAGEPGISRQ